MKSFMVQVGSIVLALAPLIGLAVTGRAVETSPAAVTGAVPAIRLPPLPYPQDALNPYISARLLWKPFWITWRIGISR